LSRLPSSRSSSAASASSRSASGATRRPGVLVQSPKSDIYVAMLGISLAAVLLGCLLMIVLFSRYNFSTKVSGLSVSSPVVALVQANPGRNVASVGMG
jgi:hypothetical protein